MTSEDSNRLDDAEFEAFLQGEGELARQLQGLPQPSPSAALDAAILAQADALAKAEAPVQQAANDALSGKAAKPGKPHFLIRWSTQLAMAACTVLAVLVTLRWQAEPAVQAYDAAPQAEPAAQPAAPIAAPPPAAVEMEPQAKPELPRPKAASHKAPSPTTTTAEAKSSVPVNIQDMQATSAYAPAPTPAPPPAPTRQNYAGSPSQPASPENSASRVRAIIMPAAPVAAVPAPVVPAPESNYSPPPAPAVAAPAPVYSPAPAPALASGAVATTLPTQSELAPVVASSGKSESPARAEAWLSAIDEMLKAGLRQDALEEWEKFKRAYPDYPVPEKLRTQIRLLQK
ncbi:hypothetical protein BCF11_4387 [Collimonas sp. PA-H2]|uniref:hypothetical protein n=1 Tax=Collimonas sp. PA-H2 TaxID=1881062 RepID=UPI000BF8D654|nr:hypothetical protein [Collimonas sp. PA-H2]PFH11920.1 hypothetical protein BCF11_4387 [Collimonas sp. PA-H2]